MAYISEIKSRNDPSSADDYVEVVIGPGEDPADFELALYRRNGNPNGTVGVETGTLGQTLPDGSRIYTISIAISEGSNDNARAAVALVSDTDGVLNFVAVGNGNVTANGGPADGEPAAIGRGNSVPGDSHYWEADGTYVGEDTSTPGVICFAKGTLIATKQGLRLVEDLCVHDQILTRDNGYQHVQWIGRAHRSAHETAKYENLRPVVVRKDAFGVNCPSQDLHLSPQHRVLSTHPENSLLFCESETLVAAKQMINETSITSHDACDVTYFHLMFDNHQIICSNNVWTESFLPNDYGLSTMSDSARVEFETLFPHFDGIQSDRPYVAARYALKCYEAKVLLAASNPARFGVER